MKKPIVILLAAALMAGLYSAQSPQAAEKNDDDVKVFMVAKLEHSKNVLQGLATEDFQLIAKHSQDLTLLSLDAGWHVIQTPEYAELSLAFRKSSQALTEAAKKKNLDGATLAFVELTFKCVQCHKYVRSVEMARLDDEKNPLLRLDQDTAALTRQASALLPIAVVSSDE